MIEQSLLVFVIDAVMVVDKLETLQLQGHPVRELVYRKKMILSLFNSLLDHLLDQLLNEFLIYMMIFFVICVLCQILIIILNGRYFRTVNDAINPIYRPKSAW